MNKLFATLILSLSVTPALASAPVPDGDFCAFVQGMQDIRHFADTHKTQMFVFKPDEKPPIPCTEAKAQEFVEDNYIGAKQANELDELEDILLTSYVDAGYTYLDAIAKNPSLPGQPLVRIFDEGL